MTNEDLVIFFDIYIERGGLRFWNVMLADGTERRKNIIFLMGNVDYESTALVEENDTVDIEQDVLQFLGNLLLSHCIEVVGRKYQLIGLNNSEKFYSEYAGNSVIVVVHRSPAQTA